VKALDRRKSGSRQLLDAIVSLLRERQIGGGAVDRGLALRDNLGARAGLDMGQLDGRDRQRGLRFIELGHEFRIVDREQQLPGCDIVAARNRALADPAVDPRRNIDAGGVGLALDDERLRLDKVPEREADNHRDDERYDDGGRSRDVSRGWRKVPLSIGRRRSLRRRSGFIRLAPSNRDVDRSRTFPWCLLVVRTHSDGPLVAKRFESEDDVDQTLGSAPNASSSSAGTWPGG